MPSISKLEFWYGAEYSITGGTKMRRSGALSRVSHRLNAENPTAAIESSVEIAAALTMRLRVAGSPLEPCPGSADCGLAACSGTGPSPLTHPREGEWHAELRRG